LLLTLNYLLCFFLSAVTMYGNTILYSLVIFSLAIATALFLTRNRWMHRLSVPDYIYSRLPGDGSFLNDIESGFSSDTFQLEDNITAGDTRAGLDNVAKTEIKRIMWNRRVNFDEARRLYMEGSFAKNGIGADGRPKDPKFVSFS